MKIIFNSTSLHLWKDHEKNPRYTFLLVDSSMDYIICSISVHIDMVVLKGQFSSTILVEKKGSFHQLY